VGEPLKELITEEQFDKWLLWAAFVIPVLSAVVGGAVAVLTRKARRVLLLYALPAAAFGPANYGLWRFYRYMVRFDPGTGYHGLTSVKTLLLLALVFVSLGALVGFVAGVVSRKAREWGL